MKPNSESDRHAAGASKLIETNYAIRSLILILRVALAPMRWFLAHDVFVSYSRGDARAYARSLVTWLGEKPRGFSCAIDSLHSLPGERTPAALLWLARLSLSRIVIASESALGSPEVRREVEAFRGWPATTLIIVPADVQLREDSWYPLLPGIDPIVESGGSRALEMGRLADSVKQSIEESLRFSRRERRLLLGAAFALTVFLLASWGTWQQQQLTGQAQKEARQAVAIAGKAASEAATQSARAASASASASEASAKAASADKAAAQASAAARRSLAKAHEAELEGRARNIAGMSLRLASLSQLQALTVAGQALSMSDNPDTRLAALQALSVEPRLQRIIGRPGYRVTEVAIGEGGRRAAALMEPEDGRSRGKPDSPWRLEFFDLQPATRSLRVEAWPLRGLS